MSGDGPSGVLVVTGTGTGVGKTVVTAAIASLALAAGRRVAVVKPAQTGVTDGEPGDVEEIIRLVGLPRSDAYELARFPAPLAPASAARLAGVPPLDVPAAAERVAGLTSSYDLVLVEGAGGLLVRFDDSGDRGRATTLASLAGLLAAPVIVVAAPGLGTLNQTALTLEALDRRGLLLAGVVVGAWPSEPDLATRTNVADLETLAGRPLSGVLPQGMGGLATGDFRLAAGTGLGRELGGGFDAADFRREYAPDEQ
jgi:dethiobiotin synthetase